MDCCIDWGCSRVVSFIGEGELSRAFEAAFLDLNCEVSTLPGEFSTFSI